MEDGKLSSAATFEVAMLKLRLMTLALLGASQAAFAQQPPGAGGQLQQIPPPPTLEKAAPDMEVERQPLTPPVDSGARVAVQSLDVTGQTLFSEAELVAASGFEAGSMLNLSELRQHAAKIAAFYNDRGYFLAQAYLPAQDASDGAVTIAVIEGRYGKIDLRNGTNLSERVARNRLRGLDSNEIVATSPLERRLLLLSDVPGVRVKSTLSPGAAIGTSDLVVDLEPGRRVTGNIEADNAGNRYTGAYRLGGTVNINNPTGLGDLVSLRLLASTGGLAYGRAAYQAPVGNATLGLAYTHMRYELGREFEGLDAHGTADIVSIFASYPLIRSRGANLYALASAEAKQLEDRIDLVSGRSNKESRALSLGFSGDLRDSVLGGGWNSVSANLTFGDLDIESPAERAIDALTARSQGGFAKLQFTAARLQTLVGPLSLYGAVRGQLAFDNLDSSEKMELGGAYGVRAYPEGEAYGDQGYIATLEARLLLDRWTGKLPGQLQLIGFVDVGEVDYAHDPWFAGANHSKRSGFGAGLTWFGPQDIILRGTYAHKLGSAQATSAPDRSGRFWFQIVKLF
ncbi:ShlB/FhaC/HecB family hemolysin secretion/activation protein [Sphingosinicella rhizophila]|uniref:ShlB/FhaC/HecB family hemolysin secretion/activation protein n=1 Tax=Sphingosinicella rhizophila TaxID=3050082 RepID=A0ABU3Q8U7_9SPHN|nr:ShlB/FhaC/HecB family hemolysin secretion/activation protein [Sphingosinicella sp. GR2756]MDT9599365.1 ShlB/FhaC/HecB family hemolysin secretion/activation protein [Sphingosinicella sp. GR2756]